MLFAVKVHLYYTLFKKVCQGGGGKIFFEVDLLRRLRGQPLSRGEAVGGVLPEGEQSAKLTKKVAATEDRTQKTIDNPPKIYYNIPIINFHKGATRMDTKTRKIKIILSIIQIALNIALIVCLVNKADEKEIKCE